MLTNGQLYQVLEDASRRYSDLKKRFAEFSGQLQSAFTQNDPYIKGVTLNAVLDANFLDLGFAGRTFRLVFTTAISEQKRGLVGVVRCYAVVEYPEKKLVDTGGFSFSPRGESNIIGPPPDDDPLHIDWELSARYIALHLINEALAKLAPELQIG